MASSIATLVKSNSAAVGQLVATARRGASPAAKAETAARDFEAVFLSTMFNHMFTSTDGEGPLGGGGGTGVWRSFLTDEYAKSFARAGGIGLAAPVQRALLDQQEARQARRALAATTSAAAAVAQTTTAAQTFSAPAAATNSAAP